MGELTRAADFLKKAGIPEWAFKTPDVVMRERPDGSPIRPDLSRDLPPGECPSCHGVGFVASPVQVGERGRKVSRAVPCSCEGERERLSLLRWAHLPTPPAGDRWRFGTYEDVCPDATTARLLVQEWAAEDGLPWLMLAGNVGTGKTHLACAAAEMLIDRGLSVAFHVLPELMAQLGEAIGQEMRARENHETLEESPVQAIRERVLNTDCLILDDLGAQRDTGYVGERLYEYINHRYLRRTRLIVTTNDGPKRLDDRLRSRLTDTRICREIPCFWGDYRQTSPAQGTSAAV